MKFSLIIPAKNEEKRIILPLLEYYAALHRRFGAKKFEILVVVNNTTDNTVKVLRTIKSALKAQEIKIHNIGVAEAKGRAVIYGMQHARGKYVAFTDADGSYSAQEVMRLYRTLVLSNTDIIIPNRYSSKSHLQGELPFLRKLISRAFNTVIRSIFGLQHPDTQGGLKIFTRTALKTILPTISTFGWLFDINLLASARSARLKVVETPITWSQKEGSNLSVTRNALPIIRELCALALRQYIQRPLVALAEGKA